MLDAPTPEEVQQTDASEIGHPLARVQDARKSTDYYFVHPDVDEDTAKKFLADSADAIRETYEEKTTDSVEVETFPDERAPYLKVRFLSALGGLAGKVEVPDAIPLEQLPYDEDPA